MVSGNRDLFELDDSRLLVGYRFRLLPKRSVAKLAKTSNAKTKVKQTTRNKRRLQAA